MARIAGINLPLEKRIEYALPYVYGIGLPIALIILEKLHISFDVRVKNLTEKQVAEIQKEVSDNYKTEGDLRKEVSLNIRRLQEIGSYRGFRHKKKLPVRGQRTKTNASSAKRKTSLNVNKTKKS